MKLPLKSLKQYVECDLDLEKILEIISRKIGAIEGYVDLSKMYTGIYIGEILSTENHPDADRLGLYTLTIGEPENIQVVAGDKSINVGDKVAYIKPGYILPSTYNSSSPLKIKSVKVRGVISNGMLCSEKELLLGPDHSKVLILNKDANVGLTFAEYYDLNDIVIEIENKALTNRGDLFGIIGLAREIAAAQNIKFESPDWYKQNIIDINSAESFPITVSNKVSNLCPRYVCISMNNIVVDESPIWLKSLLLKSGIRPINNVVDITNYLSISTGQPLHAFDYDKLVKNDPKDKDGAHIDVRLAKDGEKIHTLDGNLIELNSNNLVIADSTNPIAIAGVIGGIDTEIDNTTKRIVLESANFNRFSIRKTSMELGIFTDAVTRYTKGQHPHYCLPIILKAISLIQELGNGEISSNIVDIYPEPQSIKTITIPINKLNLNLGTNLSKAEIKNILQNIEYEITEESKDDEYITVIPPIFRTDIFIPEDIYEDVGRIYGYENIVPKLPTRDIKATKINRNVRLKQRIRGILSNSGCNEIDTYSFTSSQNIKKSNQDPNNAYHIKNALSPELSLMRTSLLTSAFEKAKENIQRNIPIFCLYEFNIPHQKGYLDNFQLPKEDWHLSILFSSNEDIVSGNSYYQIKRYFEKITNKLGVDSFEYDLVSESSEVNIPIWLKNIIPSFNSNSASLIKYTKNNKEEVLGIMGDIHIDVKKNFKLPVFTGALEINLEMLRGVIPKGKIYREESKYPPISQDLCFTIKNDIKYKDLSSLVLNEINSKSRVGSIECLDIYQKDKEYKNITLRVTIEHKERTLTDKDYQIIKEKIEKKVSNLNK